MEDGLYHTLYFDISGGWWEELWEDRVIVMAGMQ
jgi:hypothetical protein